MRHGDYVDKFGVKGGLATRDHEEVGTISSTCAKVTLNIC